MCLCTVASELRLSPLPISSNDGEYPCSATKREMKSYTSRCLRVIAMPPLLANIKRMSRGISFSLPATARVERTLLSAAFDFGVDLDSELAANPTKMGGPGFASFAKRGYLGKRPRFTRGLRRRFANYVGSR